MKRFLSWVALWASEIVIYFIMVVVGFLFAFVMDCIASVGPVGRIIIIVVSASTMIGALVTPYTVAFPIIKLISDAICETKKGMRYTLFGWVNIAYVVLNVIYVLLGARVSSILLFAYSELVYLSFGLFLLFAGSEANQSFKENEKAKIEEEAIRRYKEKNE